MRVLVVDVGGSHIKLAVAGTALRAMVESSGEMGPAEMLERVEAKMEGWGYDVVSLGYPGQVGPSGPIKEPGNLGPGWVGFDFGSVLDKPVRIVNDAVMQALGAYRGGRMLFLGLGTGLGSALVSEQIAVPLELGELPYRGGKLMDAVGRNALEQIGHERWRDAIYEVVPALLRALMADYLVLGGGNAAQVDPLPENTECGGNDDAVEGGHRLWRDAVEPIDSTSAPFWRVVP